MAVQAAPSPSAPRQGGEALGPETLYAIVAAIAKGPDLSRVLPGVVELLSDATDCHACFIYLLEGETLRMRAASRIYSHLVGKIELSVDEGLCGWVARHREPAFIRENAIGDPRTKVFPELDEEHFQSMVAVPLIGARERVVGVVVLHTEAPREFGRDVLDFLRNVASLVTGAIHNARLFEETRRRAARLTSLTALGQQIAAVGDRQELYRVSVEGLIGLLDAASSRLLLVDHDDDRLDLVAAAGDPVPPGPTTLLPPGPGRPELAARLTAGNDELGALVVNRRAGAFGPDDARLLHAVANQLAVALQKVELIERLTGENLVSDLFAALAAGRISAAESRARAARYDLLTPGVIAAALPARGFEAHFARGAEHTQTRLRRLVPGALVDAGGERLRALLPLREGDTAAQLARVDAELELLAREERLAIGRSEPRAGLLDGARCVEEADHAARVVRALHPLGGAAEYAALGAYRYLERGPGSPVPDERHAAAVAVLIDYDGRRESSLTETLEAHLGARGAAVQTARRLYIHPNTLRQRLERIEELTQLNLAEEDLLSLELALKLARLRGVDPPVE